MHFSKFICITALFTIKPNDKHLGALGFVLSNTVFAGIEHVSVVDFHPVSLILQQHAILRNG